MWSGCKVFRGERAAVLLTLMLACLSGLFVRKLHRRDLVCIGERAAVLHMGAAFGCGFCILVQSLPGYCESTRPTRNPRVGAVFPTRFVVRVFAAIIVVPHPWRMLRVGTTSALLAAVPGGTEYQAPVSQRSGRRHLAGDLAQAGLRWRHFGSVAERGREEECTAVLPVFATPRCILVACTAVLLALSCSFGLSGSRTQRRVRLCCSRVLLTNGCSWRHSSSRAWKKCCGPSVLERWTHR